MTQPPPNPPPTPPPSGPGPSHPSDWRHRAAAASLQGVGWRSGRGNAGNGGGGESGGNGGGADGGGGPVVGISADLVEPEGGGVAKVRAVCAMAYCRAVAAAGGTPVILPPIEALAAEHVRRCDAFVLTGGDDPRTEPFGEPTHPKAVLVHPERQAYETALLRLLNGGGAAGGGAPVLGVCLGMQMMALAAGGKLNQHLPDDVPTASMHAGNAVHGLRVVADGAVEMAGSGGGGGGGGVTSSHHQAVRDPGRLRVVAVAEDGVIEAIDDPSRRFYLGVQWHPERTADVALGMGLFAKLVEAARALRG